MAVRRSSFTRFCSAVASSALIVAFSPPSGLAGVVAVDTVIVPAGSLAQDEVNGRRCFAGQVLYDVPAGNTDSLFVSLSLHLSGDTTSGGLSPFELGGAVGAIGRARGRQSIAFRCLVPEGALNREFRARVVVSDSTTEYRGNLRAASTRVFYIGNSLAEWAEYFKRSEQMVAESKSGTAVTFNGTTVRLDGNMTRHTKARWDLPGGETVGAEIWGWSGATAETVYARGVEMWVPKADSFAADFVVVTLGINDGGWATFDPNDPLDGVEAKVDAHMKSMARLADTIRALGAVPVFISTPAANEAMDFNGYDLRNYNQVLARIADGTRRAAELARVRFVDLFHPYLAEQERNPAIGASDGLHPTAEGYDFIAALICRELGYLQPFSEP